MGQMIKQDPKILYQQDDGETTAWSYQTEEKMELSHEGTPEYKKIFYILFSIGLLYLLIVFTFVH